MDPRTPPRRGRLFIVSAPSGAGKTTLCSALRRRIPTLGYSVSATTRAPRPGEREGIDYFFTDPQTFEAGIREGRWAEWARVHDHYYGTPAAFLDRAMGAGQDLLLDIDVQGAAQLVERYPDSVTIFIEPPSMAVLARRLAARGTDDPASVARRLRNAEAEMRHRGAYRHRIVNDRLEEALDALAAIVSGPDR
jgi:guanylate kinase